MLANPGHWIASGLAWTGPLLVVLWGWVVWVAPDSSARRAALVTGPLAALAAWMLGRVIDVKGWPVDVLEPVREGDGFIVVSLSWGDRGYALREPWWDLLGQTPWARLDGAVGISMALALGCAVILAAWARWRTADRWAAPVLIVGVMLSPVGRVAVMSGDVGPLMWPWLLASLAGLAAAWGATSWPKRATGAVVAVLAVLPALSERLELGALLGVSLGVGVLHACGLGRAWTSASASRRRAVGWGVGIGLVLLAAVPFDLVLRLESEVGRWSPVVRVFHPLDGSLLWVWPFLLASCTPGVALLVARGAWRPPATNLGLGIGAFVVFRMAHSAAHGRWLLPIDHTVTGFTQPAPLELLRYVGYTLPVWIVLAVEGWRALGTTARRWVAVFAVLPAAPLLVPMEDGTPGWTARGHVDRDATREVRALVVASRAAPGAWFSARLHRDERGERWYGWHASLAGQRHMAPQVLREAPQPPDPDQRWLVWHGLACNVPGEPCPSPGVPPLWSWTFPALPHIDSSHGLSTQDPVTLRLFEVTGAPPSP